MRVNSLISSARLWLTCALAASGAGMAQAGDVDWSVDVDVPVERHGRIGTTVSNVPGGVYRGGQTVVVAPAPVVVHQAPRVVHRAPQVVYVTEHPGHGRPHWAGHRRWAKYHHHRHDHREVVYVRDGRGDRDFDRRDSDHRDHRRGH